MIKITQVTALKDDLLEVKGFDDSNPALELVANGWQSAMTNHYDKENYLENKHLKKGSKPREMSKKEKEEYWLRLLKEIAPKKEILFENKQNKKILEKALEAKKNE